MVGLLMDMHEGYRNTPFDIVTWCKHSTNSIVSRTKTLLDQNSRSIDKSPHRCQQYRMHILAEIEALEKPSHPGAISKATTVLRILYALGEYPELAPKITR